MANGSTPQQAVPWLNGAASPLAVVFVQPDNWSLAIHLQPGHSKAIQVPAGRLNLLPTCNVIPAAGDLLAEADEPADVCGLQCHEEGGTEGSSETAGSQLLDTAQPAGSLQRFQVPHQAHSYPHWLGLLPQLTKCMLLNAFNCCLIPSMLKCILST